MRRILLGSAIVALAAIGSPPAVAAAGGRPDRMVAQVEAPAASPDVPRVMAFSWTLYPRMWAEIDLRLAAGAEAVAEVVAEGGEVRWNLHVHPSDTAPAAFVTLAQGVTASETIRCAPEGSGRYSYLFENDGNAGPVRLRVQLRLTGDARLDAVKP
ncbi:MAG TPA: hypothetical protein VHQ69_08085 [Methylomirabilota bacterium]|nr:hypothetical protein [Methylomirabilota bacterium]